MEDQIHNEENYNPQKDLAVEPKQATNKVLVVVFVLVLSNILTIAYFFYKSQKIVIPDSSDVAKVDDLEKNLDADLDGLSDKLEQKIGTDPNNKDSDGDGYSDFDEYQNGYNPLGENDFVVEWKEWPIRTSYKQFFVSSKVSDLFDQEDVANKDYMGGGYDDVYDFFDILNIYEIGKVISGDYINKGLYLLKFDPMGPGYGISARVIKDDDNLIVITKQSNSLTDWYKDLFIMNDDIKIANLETKDDYEVSLSDKSFRLTKSESQSILLYEDIKESEELFELEGKTFYKNIQKGCVFTRANDGTIREYFFDEDFIEKKDGYTGRVPRAINIVWLDGSKNEDDYIISSDFGCGITGCYRYSTYIKYMEQLIEVGKTSTGDAIYELKDKNTKRDETNEKSVLQVIYDESHMGDKEGDYEAFINDHPLIYWQDPFGSFVEFRNAKYQPMAECGKPVIYLYPETEIDAQVYVEPTGGFTVTEPAYNDGWLVRAQPDGELYNYADETVYPYLFWEGYAMDYYRPEKGFVVAREDVQKFLVDKLTLLGLVKHEYDEFIEYWLPRMQDKPYYFVTFMDQADFEELAPLTVIPKPEKVIRVFMDYEGLDEYVVVEEPEIVTPERSGFTVVEWGGALHR